MAAVEKRKPRSPSGARPILTRALGKRIFARVEKGLPYSLACRAEGVSANTADEWVRRGEGRDERPPTALMIWFAAERDKARARFVQPLAVAIAQNEDWRAKAWTLEKIAPEEYARPADRIEVTGPGGGDIVIRLAFDQTPIAAKTRGELGGPVIEGTAEEIT